MDLLFESNRLASELAREFRKSLITEGESKKSSDRVIAAYSGEFQPFHSGHFKVYELLVKKFGKDNVYITTTDTNDESTDPLSYEDKKSIITNMFDISGDKFQLVENLYVPKEILVNFDADKTSFVTIVSEEDAARLSKSKYFHRYVNNQPLKHYNEAGYYVTVPEIIISVGKQTISNSQAMQILGSSKTKDDVKKKLFHAMYGKDNDKILDLISKKTSSAAKDIDGEFDKTDASGKSYSSKNTKTDASGQDTDTKSDEDDNDTPPMKRMVTNPETGREIKVQSALKYPRWKPVYKKAERILKKAGIDRDDRVEEPEVNQRYKARAKNMTKEGLSTYLGSVLSTQMGNLIERDGIVLTLPEFGDIEVNFLVEGGAGGHMAHPYEDTDLTFDDLREIIKRGLAGGLDKESPITEKLDGQNIQFSFRDGKIIFARNVGHVKNKGKTALDVNAIRDKFKGRGEIEHSFGNAADDLQSAILALSDKQRDSMFKGGSKWVNLEIINSSTKNVIPYDKNVLVFHNTVEYDKSGNVVNTSLEEGEKLAWMIQSKNAERQKTYGIQGPQNIVFSDKSDIEYDIKSKQYINDLKHIMSSNRLSRNSTLGEYYVDQWKLLIKSKLDSKGESLPRATIANLARRWALGDKSAINARQFKQSHPELKMWFNEIDGDSNNINKFVRKPIEQLFLKVGADSLVRMTNFMSANNPSESEAFRKEVLSSIKTLKDDGGSMDVLQHEIERLNSIGMDKIVPSEGVVFVYKGRPYKFTGTFAPINQLMGILKFGRPTKNKKSEASPNTGKSPVVVYPGRFQPFHAGHYSVYKRLVDKYGKDNVYIASSDKTDSEKSPFGFNDKKRIITTLFDVPKDKVVQVKNPYAPIEILTNYPEDTPYITAVSDKDATRLSAHGKYYQPAPSDPSQRTGGYKSTGYVDIVPKFQMDINGENISGTAVRSVMSDPNRSEADKKSLFVKMYGRFNPEIFKLLTTKLSSKATPSTSDTTSKKTQTKSVRTDIGDKRIRNPETDNDILVKTALKYDKTHPAYKAAEKVVRTSK